MKKTSKIMTFTFICLIITAYSYGKAENITDVWGVEQGDSLIYKFNYNNGLFGFTMDYYSGTLNITIDSIDEIGNINYTLSKTMDTTYPQGFPYHGIQNQYLYVSFTSYGAIHVFPEQYILWYIPVILKLSYLNNLGYWQACDSGWADKFESWEQEGDFEGTYSSSCGQLDFHLNAEGTYLNSEYKEESSAQYNSNGVLINLKRILRDGSQDYEINLWLHEVEEVNLMDYLPITIIILVTFGIVGVIFYRSRKNRIGVWRK